VVVVTEAALSRNLSALACTRIVVAHRFSKISSHIVGAANASDLEPNERIVGLDAIKNLGPQEVPQIVSSALAHEQPLLRGKGLMSLQRMDADTTYPILRSALHSDPDYSVHAVAANLLGDTRRVGGCDDLCQAALQDSSEEVRAVASRSLGEWTDTNPEAKRVLQQVSSQDASQSVRKIAD
jgi:hypothetical protein